MVSLGLEPGSTGWKVQKKPLIYGGILDIRIFLTETKKQQRDNVINGTV